MLRKLYHFLLKSTYGLVWGPRRYRYLYQAIRKVHPQTILEIGTWRGGRAVKMIKEAARFHDVSQVRYFGFDLFEGMTESLLASEVSKLPLGMAEVEGLLRETGAQINLYKGDTKEMLPLVVKELPKIDFVFIDGGHSVETIQNDWACVQRVIHEKTIVLFDDYWRDRTDAGAKSVVDSIDRGYFTVTILPRIDVFKKEWGNLEIQMALVTQRSTKVL